MKTKVKMVHLLSILFILLLVFNTQAFGQEERKIKMDEYQAQLADWQQKEAETNAKIEQLDAEIADLKQQIADTQGQIDATWDEIYAMLGTDKAGVEAYRSELNAIDSEIDGLAALSPEELFRHREDIEDIEKRIEEKKTSKIALLTEMENKFADMESKIAALKAKMPANIYDQYTVIRGDYLWKISKKDEIYGDAYQWILIYCVNKDQIKDPDLIYPEQIFNIARGVGMDEHLVVKGEYLSKIAGCAKVFNDPTKWTKIYEANKDVVTDPNIIYPYQVLKIPVE
jgi:nucleoid-associated protein YgaU